MRIEKDAFFAHQVMWNGWVDTDKFQTYIIGHWNYPEHTVKPVYVVSNGEQVELLLNGKSLGKGKRESHFLFTFDKVAYQAGRLEAVSYDGKGREVSRYTLSTVGEAARLELTAMPERRGRMARRYRTGEGQSYPGYEPSGGMRHQPCADPQYG